ncbi:MAG: restriction endonuclease subunit S [Methylotenera sp.]|nr:restriction endonuclease subunit S [Methylotenera sp.]
MSVQLDSICNFEKGNVGLAKAVPGIYPLVTTGSGRRTCDSYQFDTKAVCIPLVSSTGHGHASLNNVHYQDGKFALGSILVALTAKDESQLDIQYLHLYLSELKDHILVPLMSGAANVALSISKIKSIKIPLPYINRQREIVRKFNLVKLEDEQLKFELINQQSLLRKLRCSILEEAFKGNLTADWRLKNSNLEQASKLYERKSIPNNEKTFEIPSAWIYVQISDIFNFIDYRGKTPKKLKSGMRLITAKNVKSGFLSLEPQDFISDAEYTERMTRGYPKNGDILFTTEAPLGNVCILNTKDEHVSTGQRVITLQSNSEFICNKFFVFFMQTQTFQELLLEKASGVTAKGIKASRLKEILLPLTSISEQNVLVAKIENLFTICDQFEAQIANNQSYIKQLMQLVLKEAFSQSDKVFSESKAKAT